jgi:hypothetical protein
MPKNYLNSVIYKIYCKDESVKDIYVGETTNFTNRKAQHKDCCNMEGRQQFNEESKFYYKTSRNILYQVINLNGGWNNWVIDIIEKYPCENKEQLLLREGYWIKELNATLNKNVKLTREEYKKEWYNKHREVVRQKQKEYREAIKELYTINLNDLENNPQWFKNNVLNRRNP